ncbi:hypothetical protein ACLFLE_03165 [Providencia vermicola]|uniref:hypothetical protein n=1 Tax=Providencia vermicola TaxID=333965 RepID=UPI00397A9CC0
MACYDCFFVQSMPRASKQQARYAVGRCLMLWSSNDVTQQGSRPKTKLDARFGVAYAHRKSTAADCFWQLIATTIYPSYRRGDCT